MRESYSYINYVVPETLLLAEEFFINSFIYHLHWHGKLLDWIPIPDNWNKNIAHGMTYNTSEEFGEALYQQVQDKLKPHGFSTNTKLELGLGIYKVQVIEAYYRRCAVTGEKNLPLLEVTDIKPYSLGEPLEVYNGILLRNDYYSLFKLGYMTIDRKYNIVISRHIKEDFEDGREWYSHHGKTLTILPERLDQLPNPQYLEWHNENVFLG